MSATEQQLESLVRSLSKTAPTSKADFDAARRRFCSQLRISQPPNRELLRVYQNLLKKKRIDPAPAIVRFCRKADVRNMSGIAVVTSLLKPYACPGKCVYCPTEVRMPKRYLASEPAAARSLRLDFNPYELMKQRIEMLERNGHAADKIA